MENQPNRLTVTEIKNEALRFFNLEKGIPFTFLSLLKKPYKTIQTYLFENRGFISNPLKYLFFSVALYTLIINYHSGFRTFFAENKTKGREVFGALAEEFHKAQEIYMSSVNILYILAVPLVALFTYWFFKSKYNYAENLAIHCYMYGTANWVSFIVTLLTLFLDIPFYFQLILMAFTFLILTYFIKHIFKQGWLTAIGIQMILYVVFLIVTQIYLYSIFGYFVITK